MNADILTSGAGKTHARCRIQGMAELDADLFVTVQALPQSDDADAVSVWLDRRESEQQPADLARCRTLFRIKVEPSQRFSERTWEPYNEATARAYYARKIADLRK